MKGLIPVAALATRCLSAVATTTPTPSISSRQVSEPAPVDSSSRVRVRLYGDGLRVYDDNNDTTLWVVPEGNSSTTTVGDVSLTLDGTALGGHWYKTVYTRFIASLGERIVGAGVSTDEGGPISLSIKGLPEGTHSLLTWHNAWDKLTEAATLAIAVDGEEVLSNVNQSIRVDNIWTAASSYVTFNVTSADQVVKLTYTPTGADNRAFLNGFEIDGPDLGYQIGFPIPTHLDEHFEGTDKSATAVWHAPDGIESPKYNIYLGTTPTDLKSISLEQIDTEVTFSDLNTDDFYYWRVDVIDGETTSIGRVWYFRLAQLAFPGAEGYGRFARGGRGGKVVKVTSLQDSLEPGTLRYALTVATGPRIVVFDVSGVITTTSRMSVNSKYITLAGQTAPGKGIVIQGWPIGLTGASDIIFRHMRVRPGSISNQTVDGMGMQGSDHSIFDRCSMGWAKDECFSSRSAYNITFQRNMISEPLNVAGHKNYPPGHAHGYSATISGDIGSFHHNLLAHAEGRSWSMGGGVDADGSFAGRIDMRNNVVYNFGYRPNEGGTHEGLFVNNVYKQGPNSNLTYAFMAQYEDGLPGTQQYYCAGNMMPGIFNEDSVQYVDDGVGQNYSIACWANVSISPPPTYQKFFEDPFFESHVTTQSASEAYKRVLSDPGASQPVFDDHDKRIANETLTGTYTYAGSVSGKKGLIDNEADAGGLEDFPAATRPATWDADDNGIADWWDGSTGGEGYTPIEGYLNFMAEPHVFVEPDGSVVLDLGALARGFVDPVFTVSGESKGTVQVDGVKTTYVAGSDEGIDHLTVDIEDSEGSTWSRPFGVAIFAGAGEV